MGGGVSFPADKHIVIVGAGYGGAILGMELLKGDANFTIINPSDCFHHNIGAVRAVIDPVFSEKILIPLEKSFGKHFKQDKMVAIKPEEKKVVLSSADEISYDFLIIATGTKELPPMKLGARNTNEALDLYKKESEKISAADRVAIIGGGPTGVETAAEIAYKYPDKEVVLIHNKDVLVSKNLTDKSQNVIRSTLSEMGVEVVLGEKVTNLGDLNEDGPFTLTTDKERTLEVDYVLKSVGLTPTAEAYGDALGTATEENGMLKVNEFLQVIGHEDAIYAIGDCNNVKENKTGYQAIEQAKVLSKTLHSILNDGNPVAYKPGSGPANIVLSLGPNMAVGELKNGMGIPGFLLVRLKSRDMLAGKYWKELGQKMPS